MDNIGGGAPSVSNRKERRAAKKQNKNVGHRPVTDDTTTRAPGSTHLFVAAVRRHQEGHLAEAEILCRQVLAINAQHADSLHLLGIIAAQTGRPESALELIGQAIGLRNDLPSYHNDLGVVLLQQGQLDGAAASYRRAIAITPDAADAHYNLGVVLMGQGKLDDAAASYRRALATMPDFAEAHYNLGNVLKDQGQLDDAVASYRRALALAPDRAEAHFHLGNLLQEQGKLADAVASYQRALAIETNDAGTHFNLGGALQGQGQIEAAAACYQRALAIAPDFAEAHYNLGNTFQLQGKLEAAAGCYQRAVLLKPDFAEGHNNLGSVLKDQGKLGEAIASYRRALALKPDFAVAHSNLLLVLQYDAATSQESLFREHRLYGACAPLPSPLPRLNPPDPSKRLKIGYVSPDFKRHPVGYFVSPVLGNHDRESYVVYCYSDTAQEDEVTAACKSAADFWHATIGMTDAELEAAIRADGIDILIDLSGHTRGNRLSVFARKPAPIQASWAGYVGTTGLPAMDYVITDPWESPPGSENYAVEKLMRLEHGYVCYRPPDYAPAVSPLPAKAPGDLTFGCFNNFAKVNPQVIALWCRLLAALPESRLVLKTGEFRDDATRRRAAELFAAEGIAGERVTLEGFAPHRELLRHYNDIDIALDPFPYSGGLTTIESLWMGVPVVTLGGKTFAARHSLSHLNVVGLGELVASDEADYLRIVQDLAQDIPRLAALRADLRRRMRASPMLQVEHFTRGLETAFREMWQTWCLKR